MNSQINTVGQVNFPSGRMIGRFDGVMTIEAALGSSYNKLTRRVRRRDGRSAERWYSKQIIGSIGGWSTYNCGAVYSQQ